MKINTIFTAFLVLAVFSAHTQPLVVSADDNNRLTVQSGSIRLTGGYSAIDGQATGTKHRYIIRENILLLSIGTKGRKMSSGTVAGFLFDDIPQLRRSVALWRYKPWNSWTKPMQFASALAMPEDDVQFYYWQYQDGTYGAAVPLSGSGFRTTIGANGKSWGSRSLSYAPVSGIDTIPAMAIAFGRDPYQLFKKIYEAALTAMGKGSNLRTLKKFPKPFHYIGWCTWNASANGKNLNDSFLVTAARSFSDHGFPLGWLLIDDGWFQSRDRQLQSFEPNPQRFPGGFKPVIDQLKSESGIRYFGIWHAFNGLWNGIDPGSPLGKRFGSELFSWKQPERPDMAASPVKTYHFIRPGKDSLYAFYNSWHRYLKQQGFDFVKVDNQLVVEKMAVNNYPIFTLSDSMHVALYRSVNTVFDGAVINCMDMTADAYLNFGGTAVARSVEDYFPYTPGETYNLQKGNAAAHVLQAIYNSLYFGQMSYPDFDIFQSHHVDAVYHAIARAINCGPVYITDEPGKQRFDVLWPLIYADGRIIRSDSPLVPAADCLFQVQEVSVFKAFSLAGGAGLLGVWNAADADTVKGAVSPHDVNGLPGEQFLLYEHFSKSARIMRRNEQLAISLPRMAYRLYAVIPVENGFAPVGLTEKYNSPATILSKHRSGPRTIKMMLAEGGAFKAFCAGKPVIKVNGKPVSEFTYRDKMIDLQIEVKGQATVEISW